MRFGGILWGVPDFLYLEGKGCELMGENMTEMDVQQLQAEADNGNAEAAFLCGDCFMKGIGVAQNAKKAVQMYKKSANADYAPAQHQLGICYEMGIGVGRNVRDALKWYRKSAQNHFIPAMISMGICCEKGLGQAVDLEEAAQWYLCAAQLGDHVGTYHLARLLESGMGIESDPVKAAEYYLIAAHKNVIAAQVAVGRCFRDGVGVERDEEKAFHWFSAAAERGNPIAQWNVGNCHEQGIGTAADSTAAVEWYQKAADQDYVPAIRDLGRCLRDGIGSSFDIDRSIALLERAAEMNDLAAAEELVVCMMLGLGKEKDVTGAAKLYRRIRGGKLMNENQLEDALRFRLAPAEQAFRKRIETGKLQCGNAVEEKQNAPVNLIRRKVIPKEFDTVEECLKKAEEKLCSNRGYIDRIQIPTADPIMDRINRIQEQLTCEESERAAALAASYIKERDNCEDATMRASREIHDLLGYISKLREDFCRHTEKICQDGSSQFPENWYRMANSIKEELGYMKRESDFLVAHAEKISAVCNEKAHKCYAFLTQAEDRLKEWQNCCKELRENASRCSDVLGCIERLCAGTESVRRDAEKEKAESEQGSSETLVLQKKWEHEQTAEAVRDMRELWLAAVVACEQAEKSWETCKPILEKNRKAAERMQKYPNDVLDIKYPTAEHLEKYNRKADETRTVLGQMLQDMEILVKQKEITDAIAARLLKIEQLRTNILSKVRASVEDNWVDFGDAGPEMALHEANRLIRQKERGKAVAWLRRAAELGNAEAQNQLAFVYERGKLIPQNKEEAFYWYRLAAEQGYPVAECNLAVCYAEGVGTNQDMVQALKWYQKAAQNHEPRAQFQMGRFCLDGTNMPKNEEQAANWFRSAAEQGNADACLELAECFRKGIGVPQNLQQAMYWGKRAKEAK